MARVPVTAARDNLSEIVSRVAYSQERVLLTRHGKNVACLVPVEDAVLLDLIEARLDLSDARAALKELREQGAVPWSHVKADFGV